ERRQRRAARGSRRLGVHRVRALLPGVSVRDLGRQERQRGDGGGAVRNGRRGLSGGLSAAAVLLVGCGKMGGAMIAGWRERGLTRAVVVEPAGAAALKLPNSVAVVADAAKIPADFKPDVVVLAVKPQVMDDVAPAYAKYA